MKDVVETAWYWIQWGKLPDPAEVAKLNLYGVLTALPGRFVQMWTGLATSEKDNSAVPWAILLQGKSRFDHGYGWLLLAPVETLRGEKEISN